MDMNFETGSNHSNLYLSIGSFLGSIAGFVVGAMTKQNIGWIIGCTAGLVSIYAGLLTIKERRINIRKAEKEQQ